ncbi:MAG: asparagine synthetase B [Flavobacteriaceae bacterium CG_4_8_14_3_um_filter_34_10]|nr:DUF2911 domain-containing protein [Flavobacteriia bacterium]OIP50280.1 MAG: asparagine synthetase B [Flavobacteriaceae bacterium CG2_30_34_30]PIQ19628.1 MAG: asparagine synthetase B [Flavobacteriaceae bacterium CG18_big_fil_WC_8_21_14_2_50_34_36]PIV49043.1 MAG: asparagine synthetase B [Flavobacteriaceae bacterium CG02_land_8_20_14_3_00_34_13]PIX10552.1 MAG: asparagine synthetase B [Flavobacteriaceae bacterium CG_4_8_14_3_um_filter_34_10]PIZ08511.1 MAG: asparagine synthetase B [Flavobacteria
MKLIHLSSLFLFFFLSTFMQPVFAQEFPKIDASPMDLAIARDANKAPLIRVIYSRPLKKNRKIFGELVPFNQVWRTGANEATELDLYTDMQVGGVKINAGTYTLYTIPGEKEWTVILNKETNTWGAYSYKQEMDIARINVPARKASAPIESLSMAFKTNEDGVSLMIGWDDTFVEIPFKNL